MKMQCDRSHATNLQNVEDHATSDGIPSTEDETAQQELQCRLLNGSPISVAEQTSTKRDRQVNALNLTVLVLASQKTKEQSPEQRKTEMKHRMEPCKVGLQNYGGGKLNLIRQIWIVLSRNGHEVCAVVQVQKDIPVGLLIRTDTLPQLGFALVETDTCGMGIDLYRNRLGRSSQVEDATQCANMTNLLLTSWL